MNKIKLTMAVGGAVAIVACWPLVVGQIGQTVVEHAIAKAHNRWVKVDVEHYERSYLNSSISTKVTVVDPELVQQLNVDGLPTVYHFHTDVKHGFLSIPAKTVATDHLFTDITLDTTTQLNGNTQFELALAPFVYVPNESKGEAQLSVANTTLTGMVTKLGELTYQYHIPSSNLSFNDGSQLNVNNISGHGDGKYSDNVWVGGQWLSMSDISLERKQDAQSLSVQEVAYQWNSTIDEKDNSFSTQHRLTTGAMVLPQQEKLTNFELSFSLQGLDTASMSDIIEASQQGDMYSSPKFQLGLENILKKGFATNIDQLAVQTSDGKGDMQLHLELPEQEVESSTPTDFIGRIKGNTSLQVDKSLANALPELHAMVDELVVMELATEDKDRYVLNADIEKGQLNFANGQKIPLFSLFLPFLM